MLTDSGQSLRHLREEVIPYLESSYRANDYRVIVGVSGSSLFPIYTFLKAPELFDSHVLIAAADMVGMGLGPDETFIDAFEAALTKTPERKARLYVGAAEDDLARREDYRRNLTELTGLADALEADGRIDLAVKAQQQAIALATGDTTRLEERLDALVEQAGRGD